MNLAYEKIPKQAGPAPFSFLFRGLQRRRWRDRSQLAPTFAFYLAREDLPNG